MLSRGAIAPASRVTLLRASRAGSLRRAAPVRLAMSASASLAEQYNFGAASSLDTTVYGACRPGGAGGEEETPAASLTDASVAEWAAALKAQGITRVVSLLDDKELSAYKTPLTEQYGRLFTRCAPGGAAPHMPEYVCSAAAPGPNARLHASYVHLQRVRLLCRAWLGRHLTGACVAGCATPGTTWFA